MSLRISLSSSISQLIQSRLLFQYQAKQRGVIYLLISVFIGLVSFTISSFHPVTLFVTSLVGLSYFFSFGVAVIMVSEIRITVLKKKGQSDFNLSYGELWLLGLMIFFIGFFILGTVQVIVGRYNFSELKYYFDPANGFLPFSWSFFLQMIPPWIIDVLLVGHVILKRVPPQSESSAADSSPLDSSEQTLEDPIRIIAGKHVLTMNPQNIAHISVEQHYASFYLNTIDGLDELELKSSLVNIMKQLPQDLFCRVHRSHLVNLAHIEKIINQPSGCYVIVKPRLDQPIPISRRQLTEFKKRYEQYKEFQRSIPTSSNSLTPDSEPRS